MSRFMDWLLRPAPVPVAEHSSLSSLVISSALQNANPYGSRDERVPAIVAARRMTVDTVAALPVADWDGVEKTKRPSPVVTQPNPEETRQETMVQTMRALVDRGNAYWILDDLDEYGHPQTFRVARRHEVHPQWSTNFRRRLYFTDNGRQWRTDGIAPNLAVIAIDRGPDDLEGRGPMQSPRIAGLVAEMMYSQEFFENNAKPTTLLKHPSVLTADEAKAFVEQWDAAQTRRGTGVLSGGLEHIETGFSPSDSDWVNTHLTGILDVCNLFGMPSSLLGYNAPGGSLTYENRADLFGEWWRTGLQPTYVSRIERAWSSLLPRGRDVRLDASPLTRLTDTDRAVYYTAALAGGWLDSGEVRELEGLTGEAGRVIDRETL